MALQNAILYHAAKPGTSSSKTGSRSYRCDLPSVGFAEPAGWRSSPLNHDREHLRIAGGAMRLRRWR